MASLNAFCIIYESSVVIDEWDQIGSLDVDVDVELGVDVDVWIVVFV